VALERPDNGNSRIAPVRAMRLGSARKGVFFSCAAPCGASEEQKTKPTKAFFQCIDSENNLLSNSAASNTHLRSTVPNRFDFKPLFPHSPAYTREIFGLWNPSGPILPPFFEV